MKEWTAMEIIKLRAMWNSGKSLEAISDELVRTVASVKRMVSKERRLGNTAPRRRGRALKENYKQAIMSESTLEPIATYEEAGVTVRVYPARNAHGVVTFSSLGFVA